MLSENKKEIKNKIRDYFTERNDISAVYIFGSFNTERFNQNSDLDLAVIFEICCIFHN
jgi:predicted nucleotidyltransferase